MTEREKLIKLIETGTNLASKKAVEETVRIVKENHHYNSATDKAVSISEILADYLLESGVIVPPVKISDTVYTNCSMQGWYLRSKDRPYKAKVVYMGINGTKNYMNVVYEKGEYMLSFDFDKIGKTVFLTREEAEKALKERD